MKRIMITAAVLISAVLLLFSGCAAPLGDGGEENGALQLTNEWFDDCMMIGDSRLVGMITYCGLHITRDYTRNGFTVGNALRQPVIEKNGTKTTVSYEIENGAPADKCCILFGVNDCGQKTEDEFRRDMNELLDILYATNENMKVYLLTEFSVGRDWESNGPTPEKIRAFNEILAALAKERSACLIDLFEPFAASDGYLLDEATADGVHLNVEYTKKMCDYLLKQIAETEE